MWVSVYEKTGTDELEGALGISSIRGTVEGGGYGKKKKSEREPGPKGLGGPTRGRDTVLRSPYQYEMLRVDKISRGNGAFSAT